MKKKKNPDEANTAERRQVVEVECCRVLAPGRGGVSTEASQAGEGDEGRSPQVSEAALDKRVAE